SYRPGGTMEIWRVPSWPDLSPESVSTLWPHCCPVGLARQVGGGGMKQGNDHGQPMTIVDDPLSQSRWEQSPAGAANQTGAGKKPYEAFDTKGKLSPYLEIRCVLQPSQSPQSRFFMAAVFGSDFDDAFTLLY